MTGELNVLFICTGNIFRSMTAEYALKQHLGSGSRVFVHSAGVDAAPHEIVDFVREYNAGRGVDLGNHEPKQLDAHMLSAADLAVAMDFSHRDRIERDFGQRLPVFNQVAFGKEEALLDVCDVVPDWRNNEAASRAYGFTVMDTIYAGMAGVADHLTSLGVSPRASE
ncbi:MAG: hypothetical protein AAF499_16580 [Pseudomonadota bacterium]